MNSDCLAPYRILDTSAVQTDTIWWEGSTSSLCLWGVATARRTWSSQGSIAGLRGPHDWTRAQQNADHWAKLPGFSCTSVSPRCAKWCAEWHRKTAAKSNASTLSWVHEFITYPNNLTACDTLPVACFCSFSARVYHVTRFCSADIKNMWNHFKILKELPCSRVKCIAWE
jgi:hypothetical protein